MAERHEMNIIKTYPTGAQIWKCLTCGRSFVMQWPPHYKRIILNVGDEQAEHVGQSGGLQFHHAKFEMTISDISLDEANQVLREAGLDPDQVGKDCADVARRAAEENDPHLQPWKDAMDKLEQGDDDD